MTENKCQHENHVIFLTKKRLNRAHWWPDVYAACPECKKIGWWESKHIVWETLEEILDKQYMGEAPQLVKRLSLIRSDD